MSHRVHASLSRNAAITALICILLLPGNAAMAYRSFPTEVDANKSVKVTGAVTKVEWGPPRAWFYMDVADAKTGKRINYAIQMAPPNMLLAQDPPLTRDSITIGLRLTVVGHP